MTAYPHDYLPCCQHVANVSSLGSIDTPFVFSRLRVYRSGERQTCKPLSFQQLADVSSQARHVSKVDAHGDRRPAPRLRCCVSAMSAMSAWDGLSAWDGQDGSGSGARAPARTQQAHHAYRGFALGILMWGLVLCVGLLGSTAEISSSVSGLNHAPVAVHFESTRYSPSPPRHFIRGYLLCACAWKWERRFLLMDSI